MDVPDQEQWPPVRPDVDQTTIDVETPELVITGNSMLYRVKGRPGIVYKARAEAREYELQKAAGDCAIPVRGRVMLKSASAGQIICMGFLMDLATPIIPPPPPGPAPIPALAATDPADLPPSRRREIMHQMLRLLENMLLDERGELRLCDFAEGRFADEDERVWKGMSTWHYESPDRLVRGERMGMDPAPPTAEDDWYSVGLSIWHLYTGRVPQGDWAGDDLGLKERQRRGETVDVDAVEDPEAREVIRALLRRGGARV